jgi:hypothetical protein
VITGEIAIRPNRPVSEGRSRERLKRAAKIAGRIKITAPNVEKAMESCQFMALMAKINRHKIKMVPAAAARLKPNATTARNTAAPQREPKASPGCFS